MTQIKKVVIIGPESTGKSYLCEKLAQHYHSSWVPEYAREYLYAVGGKYSYDDLLIIAKNQLDLENKYTEDAIQKGHNTIFIDTDMFVMKIWCEYVYGKCHPWINRQAQAQQYNLYLLCKPDIPWVKDTLREYPDLETREKLFEIYKDTLSKQTLPWYIISGNYEERFNKALNAIETILK